MNWKGCGKKLVVLSRYLPGRTEKITKDFRVVGVPTEIRTGHLPNTNENVTI
jgi:hypothetical protein